MSFRDLLDDLAVTPHPALVAAQRPSPREVAEMAALLGWLPDEHLFPVVLVNRGEERLDGPRQGVRRVLEARERVHLR